MTGCAAVSSMDSDLSVNTFLTAVSLLIVVLLLWVDEAEARNHHRPAHDTGQYFRACGEM